MTTHSLLPAVQDAGEVRRWFLPTPNDPTIAARVVVLDEPADADADESTYVVAYARFLGMGTSYAATHSGHRSRFVARGERCNACRWFEVRVFRELLLPDGVATLNQLEDPRDARLGDYVIHSTGMSIVDDEQPLYQCKTTASPYTVIELLTTRRAKPGQTAEVFLAKPAARALAEASANDEQLADAYVNRAVS